MRDISPLSGLTKLKYIYTPKNQITDLRPLATLALVSLRAFDIDGSVPKLFDENVAKVENELIAWKQKAQIFFYADKLEFIANLVWWDWT